MTTIALDELTFKVKTTPSLSKSPGFSAILIKAEHPEHGCVGRLEGHQILRDDRQDCFVEYMYQETDELAELANGVFDPYMDVSRRIVNRGNRCWGEEMDEGAIVCVHTLEVPEEFGNQGIATRLLSELMASALVAEDTIVYAWPTAAHVQAAHQVVNLFRNNGFRRVGRTVWFGYSPDPDHPSRSLPAAEDVDI
ncbi:uncharacterized protein SCHCODRAFT_02616280 [Schizophyllum commune H4-8]|nr:uncharacterized protein SCHCODRAFT_02616280 [Schizophyllum commune H4-8]KAI5896946.1 hypothetical protein SCHCODRAFT_02616280 [Schizophyllum commune H4-8]